MFIYFIYFSIDTQFEIIHEIFGCFNLFCTVLPAVQFTACEIFVSSTIHLVHAFGEGLSTFPPKK